MPNLVTESGRAVSAYHCLAVFGVEEQQTIAVPVEVPALT